MNVFLSILLTLIALFLIMLILIQRGRGGGLSGALTGMGGNSAFGSKSGDVFTKITMWTAFLWIVLCAVSVKYMGSSAANLDAKEKIGELKGDPKSKTQKKDSGKGSGLPGGSGKPAGTTPK